MTLRIPPVSNEIYSEIPSDVSTDEIDVATGTITELDREAEAEAGVSELREPYFPKRRDARYDEAANLLAKEQVNRTSAAMAKLKQV